MATSLQNRIDKLLVELKDYYCKTVRNNPQTVRQLESSLRIVSFLVAGMMIVSMSSWKSCQNENESIVQ